MRFIGGDLWEKLYGNLDRGGVMMVGFRKYQVKREILDWGSK